MSLIHQRHLPITLKIIRNPLINKDYFNIRKNQWFLTLRLGLFTFLHSANFNSARTAALQDVTVKENIIATDCFKEDC